MSYNDAVGCDYMKKALKTIKNYYGYCKEKRFDTLAGTLSFFFILSFIPLLYLCLSLYVNVGAWMHLETPIPSVIEDYISFDINAGASVIFFLTTLYSASKFFTQLKKTGEIAYDIKKTKINLKSQLFSCIFVILLMIIVSAGLLAIAIGNTYVKANWAKVLVQILTYVIFFLMIISFLCLINKTTCPKDSKIKDLKKGIIFSLIYVTVVSVAFIFYVTNFSNYDQLYGFFSTIIVAFLYVFLMMQGIVVGVILNEKKINNK